MKAIHSYRISLRALLRDGNEVLRGPTADAVARSVRGDGETMCVYVEHGDQSDANPPRPMRIEAYQTGEEIPQGGRAYLGYVHAFPPADDTMHVYVRFD